MSATEITEWVYPLAEICAAIGRKFWGWRALHLARVGFDVGGHGGFRLDQRASRAGGRSTRPSGQRGAPGLAQRTPFQS